MLDAYNEDKVTIDEVYDYLPQALVSSIERVSHHLLHDRSVKSVLKEYDFANMDTFRAYICIIVTLLDSLHPLYMFDCRWKEQVLGYINPSKVSLYRYIKLVSTIKNNKGAKILEGLLMRTPSDYATAKSIVIKASYTSAILTEMETYILLRRMGCPLPWFSVNYSYWGHPVLVMEKLLPITFEKEDIRTICRNVVEQLRYVHQFGVHCDIKPGNIMKKQLPNSSGKKHRYYYYLIDYGGIATEEYKSSGPVRYFKRHTHTELYSSQRSAKDRKCQAVNDLIELGYTLNYIAWRKSGASEKIVKEKFRRQYLGICREYMRYITKVVRNGPVTAEVYDAIDSLMS